MKTLAFITALFLTFGCTTNSTDLNVVSRYDIRDSVLEVFQQACMANLGNVANSRKTLDRMGFDVVDKTSGGTLYFNAETSVFASAGDFSVTHASGGVTVDSVKGNSCYVGSVGLTPNHAKEMVISLHAAYLAGKTGSATFPRDGDRLITYSYPDKLYGKPFEITASRYFVKLDDTALTEKAQNSAISIPFFQVTGLSLVEYR